MILEWPHVTQAEFKSWAVVPRPRVPHQGAVCQVNQMAWDGVPSRNCMLCCLYTANWGASTPLWQTGYCRAASTGLIHKGGGTRSWERGKIRRKTRPRVHPEALVRRSRRLGQRQGWDQGQEWCSLGQGLMAWAELEWGTRSWAGVGEVPGEAWQGQSGLTVSWCHGAGVLSQARNPKTCVSNRIMF